MEEEVSPSESVSRFIMQKTYYRSSTQTVKYNAFMPNRDGESSVYRIIDLGDEEIFEIGRRFVADVMEKPKPLLGRADIVVSKVLKRDLKVKPYPNPHPRHANIVNWPEDKLKHKIIALQLAEEADLHLIG